MKSIFLIFIAFILTSCSNPGYSIRIYVDKGAGATENDLKLIRNYLLMRPYDVVAYSGPFRPPIPGESGHPFRGNPATPS